MTEAIWARSGLLLPADLAEFVKRHQRLPRLGDDPAPWQYRGWLLPYVIGLHQLCPAVADRWGYYLRTRQAGVLLPDPIPQISFGPPDSTVPERLREWSRSIGRDCGGWSDFTALLNWLAWGLALAAGEPDIPKPGQEQLYRRVDMRPFLDRPYDYLGDLVAAQKANGWNPTGFYPTPHNVVELMVRMMLHDQNGAGGDQRTKTVNDPCVGSGRMLLYASNASLNLWGTDIDPLAVTMCKLNGALYAPWIAFPLPASILSRQPCRQPGRRGDAEAVIEKANFHEVVC
jgi:hypothetical protein